MPKDLPKLLKKREFADALGVTTRTVTNWISAGKVSFLRTPGGHCRFTQETCDRLLRQKELNPQIKQYRPDQPAVLDNPAVLERAPTPYEAMRKILLIRRIQRLQPRTQRQGRVRDER